jgi:hypothetical protein
MSKQKKPAHPSFVSPTGIAKYPWLNKPDAGNERVQKRVPEYHVTLRYRLDDPKVQELIEKLRPLHADAVAKYRAEIPIPKQKKTPIVVKDVVETEYDDAGNETGWVAMRFKMNSEVKDKKTQEVRRMEPAIVDGLKQPVKGVAIYGGSKLRVAFSVVPFHVEANNMVGLTYYLNAVQIVELAAKQNGAANAFDMLDSDGLGDHAERYEGAEPTGGEAGDAAQEADGDF